MKSLQIELKDLHEYRANETVVFAKGTSGNGTMKELRLKFDGIIQLWHNGEILATFRDEEVAVKWFNKI